MLKGQKVFVSVANGVDEEVDDNDCEDDDGEWAVAGEEEEEEGHTGHRPLLGRPRILAF